MIQKTVESSVSVTLILADERRPEAHVVEHQQESRDNGHHGQEAEVIRRQQPRQQHSQPDLEELPRALGAGEPSQAAQHGRSERRWARSSARVQAGAFTAAGPRAPRRVEGPPSTLIHPGRQAARVKPAASSAAAFGPRRSVMRAATGASGQGRPATRAGSW